MNKKGFTLIELITTFALSTVIIVLLINVVLVIKNVYSKNDIKTSLLIEQSNLSNLINKKLRKGALLSYVTCSDAKFCYNFNYIDGTTSSLKVSEEFIIFDNYIYKVSNGTTIGDLYIDIANVSVSNDSINNSFLIITGLIDNIFNINNNFKFIYGLLEITQGLKYLSISNLNIYIKAVIASFIISFGGLCIHVQVFSILDNKKIRYLPYLCSRIIHAVISSLITLIIIMVLY